MLEGYGQASQNPRLAVTVTSYVQNTAALGGGILWSAYWQTYSVAEWTMFTSSSSCSISTVSMRAK